MDRLKWLNEGIGAKRSKLAEISNKVDTEQRARTPEEVTEWESLESEIRNLEAELASRKANPVKEERKIEAVKSTASVGASGMESKEARNIELFKVISAKDDLQRNSALQNLKDGGHYEQRDFQTLIDGKGGVFLPTAVSSEIFNLEKQYGVVPRLARSFGNILSGDLKVPSVLSKISFTGTQEGAAIAGTSFNLGGIELKAHKWAGITSWTNEIGDQAGAILIPLLQNQIAEGLAFVKDDTFLKGTGTGAYNGIKGLEALAGNVNYVRTATAASGNNSYATLDYDDFVIGTLQAAPAARRRGVFVFHPNLLPTLMLLKDVAGNYVFQPMKNADEGFSRLGGYPVYFTEAATFDSGSNKVYGYFFDPGMLAYADGRSLRVKELTEGNVKQSNGTEISLAQTDSSALRFTAMFDIKPSNAVVDDAGTTKGSFVVLKTV
jgi:HK97 family phage major capsid protein